MNKKKRLMALLVVMCILTTLLPSAPVEEYEAAEKVGTELLELMNVTYGELISGDFVDSGETYDCIIWIEDVEIETAVEAGIEAAEKTVENEAEMNTYSSTYTTYELDGLSYVDVAIDDNASDEYVQTYIEAERQAANELYADNNNNFVAENFMARDMSVTYVSQYSPCVFADLTMSKVAELVQNADVVCIDYQGNVEDKDTALSIDVSISEIEEAIGVVNADTATSTYGVTGDGIKIGQMELACPNVSSVIKNPNSNDNFVNGVSDTHSNTVYTIMNMVAPDATYYATGRRLPNNSSTEGSFYEQMEWLLSQGVNIINMSMGATGSNVVNTYTARTKWVDHIACNHNVHVVVASGNEMAEATVTLRGVRDPAMAYNVITVGNTYRTSSYNIHSTSSYNHDGYSTTTYKPDVVAPGTYSASLGTSYSAPLVTGVVALICEYRPALKTKPHAVKAILAATSVATSRRYSTTDEEFEKYGAGIVDAYSAINSIKSDSNMWSTGSLSTMGSSKSYTMSVTSADAYVRVALAYGNGIKYTSSSHSENSTPVGDIGSLDLTVYAPNGSLVAHVYSSELDRQANLKVLEFTPNGVYGNYTVKVTVTKTASNTSAIDFGLAWR